MSVALSVKVCTELGCKFYSCLVRTCSEGVFVWSYQSFYQSSHYHAITAVSCSS